MLVCVYTQTTHMMPVCVHPDHSHGACLCVYTQSTHTMPVYVYTQSTDHSQQRPTTPTHDILWQDVYTDEVERSSPMCCSYF